MGIGFLTCHDGDNNENVKKQLVKISKNNNSARASRFFVHFFAVTDTVRLRRENAKFQDFTEEEKSDG